MCRKRLAVKRTSSSLFWRRSRPPLYYGACARHTFWKTVLVVGGQAVNAYVEPVVARLPEAYPALRARVPGEVLSRLV